jgi:hypothetical protein
MLQTAEFHVQNFAIFTGLYPRPSSRDEMPLPAPTPNTPSGHAQGRKRPRLHGPRYNAMSQTAPRAPFSVYAYVHKIK